VSLNATTLSVHHLLSFSCQKSNLPLCIFTYIHSPPHSTPRIHSPQHPTSPHTHRAHSTPLTIPHTGLFQFLLRKLSAGQSLDLLVLKELLGRMGGCDTLIEMSADQLEGMAGGKFLRAEAMSAATRENVVRGTIKTLRDAFLSSGTAIPLLLLIAQVR
jgi:hypothetical protein